MKLAQFLKLIAQPGRINYTAVCSDNLGLGILLKEALAPVARGEDVHILDAGSVTKDKARQLEREARYAPLRASPLTHFFIHGLQRLPSGSVGPLLKVVEEGTYARFIFQTQGVPRKLKTLLSRTSVVRLPFMTKAAVLGNMKLLKHDVRVADQLGLYDGTLSGTIRMLQMKDMVQTIRREVKLGQRGLVQLFSPDTLQSLAFEAALEEKFSEEERRFLGRNYTEDRQKIVLLLMLARG